MEPVLDVLLAMLSLYQDLLVFQEEFQIVWQLAEQTQQYAQHVMQDIGGMVLIVHFVQLSADVRLAQVQEFVQHAQPQQFHRLEDSAA